MDAATLLMGESRAIATILRRELMLADSEVERGARGCAELMERCETLRYEAEVKQIEAEARLGELTEEIRQEAAKMSSSSKGSGETQRPARRGGGCGCYGGGSGGDARRRRRAAAAAAAAAS